MSEKMCTFASHLKTICDLSLHKIKIMIRTVGTYHFGRSYNKWGIWQVEYVSEDGRSSSSRKVENCDTAEQAYRRIYQLNGWGQPKYIPTWMTQQ
jgi:hypothetical protein